jgi:hypothetical protein
LTLDKVIFRKYEGEVIALFPEVPSDLYHPGYCQSYQHIGQHGSADLHYIISISKPAHYDEYKPLYDELVKIGYKIKVYERVSYAMDKKRNASLPK